MHFWWEKLTHQQATAACSALVATETNAEQLARPNIVAYEYDHHTECNFVIFLPGSQTNSKASYFQQIKQTSLA